MFLSNLWASARIAALISVALMSAIGSTETWAQEGPFIVRGVRNPAERRILAELEQPTELLFVEAPLSDVLNFLKDKHGIEIVADKVALEDEGIDTDTPVTVDLSDITLRSALKIMLRELQLAYTVQDEVLLITTPSEQQTRFTTDVYPVDDLIIEDSAEDLAEVVRAMRGEASDEGYIVAYGNMLLVRDTDQAHQEIGKLLGLMRGHLNVIAAKRGLPNRDASERRRTSIRNPYGINESRGPRERNESRNPYTISDE